MKIELEKIREDQNKERLIKLYLLACCEKLIKFISSGCLLKNIKVARKYINGYANIKQIHLAEWELEGEAFSVDYYLEKRGNIYFRLNKDIKVDLVKVRISMGFSNKVSESYLTQMAYFIDRVFCHVEHTSNWLFTDDCEKFMCPILYSKYFS